MKLTSNYTNSRPPTEQLDYIDGVLERPRVQLTDTIDDPNTGTVRQAQMATAADGVERALAAAADLHTAGTWAQTPIDVRAALLAHVAQGLDDRRDELAYEDAMATGNPQTVTAQLASYFGPRVLSARDQLLQIGEFSTLADGDRPVRLLRRPLGPAVVIAPWNAPTFVAVAKVASALAGGCPVILKPSEWAPAGCQILTEVIRRAIDDMELPSAALQLLHGAAEVGNQLASDQRVRAISFTGGGVGGRAVAAVAAVNMTALQLELGGHNPAILHPDADIAAAAAALAEGMTKLNGQWCEAPGKVLVADSLHDRFVEALLDQLAARRVGHCLDAETRVGPLAYRAHRQRLQAQVDELVAAGGKALSASRMPDLPGWFFAPSVIIGLPAVRSRQELFGPVVTVHAVSSTEEAIQAADGPQTGLAGFVFGADVEAALATAARLPVGEVRINGCRLADLADGSEQTFWNSAGVGGHGPTDMVRFFQGRRTIGVDDPALPI
jgi:phenylacetaldehyde dehydrogenase